MTIDEDIFLEFKRLCKENAMKVSSKVELMMKEYSTELISQQETKEQTIEEKLLGKKKKTKDNKK